MSNTDFLPASASSSKSRKQALKASSSSSSSSSSHNTTRNKPSKNVPTFLPTQPDGSAANTVPSASAIASDSIVAEFSERLPLYDTKVQPVKVNPSSSPKGTRAEEVDAAMAIDSDPTSDHDDDDSSLLIDPSSLSLPTPVTRTPISQIPGSDALSFPAVSHQTKAGLTQRRKIGIPPHRMTPLKRDWIKIYTPLVEECGLQVRMNVGRKCVEMKVSFLMQVIPYVTKRGQRKHCPHAELQFSQTSKHTPSPSSLTRASDFLSAYALGFAVEDAIALLRLEELYVESFEIKDVKTLHGDHLSRAIGRIAGHEGKTRFVIENASRTRVVLADTKIHILGTFSNIKIARDAICALILGSPPGKIYAGLRIVASRSRERF
ncbi:BQ2448_2930 [Microbotryum intermedium]|uniref:Pre-rRNA-processing protein PNO1 n=1 Tax=Microbotryum intermedium TaxID=269621 RepID=A0A238FBW7_9BASI|nr:BQ2448_2930 [Microbotryum intermedium]